jgi:TolB protein
MQFAAAVTTAASFVAVATASVAASTGVSGAGSSLVSGNAQQQGLIAIAGDLRPNLVPKVYALDVQNGVRTSIGGLDGDWDPALSPDRASLAFISARDGYDAVYVARADGSDARRVTSRIQGTPFFGGSTGCDAAESHPTWSPDGRRIAFEVTFGSFCTPPAPTPSARRLASARYTVHTPHGLALVDVDGSDLRLLSVDGFSPRLSPDGTRLAYVERSPNCFCAEPGTTTGLLDVERGVAHSLGAGTDPVWAPDGRSLALPTGHGRIGVFNRDGLLARSVRGRSAGWTRCGLVASRSGAVAVSPDLRRVALIGTGGIVVRTCAGRSRLLVRGRYEPVSFSPDGATVLVRRCSGTTCALAIAQGRKLVPIESAYRPLLEMDAFGVQQPTWSPDGGSVAFLVARGGVMVADALSGETRTVTVEGASSFVTAPVWTDEATIVYGSRASGLESNVYTLDATGHDARLVALDAAHPTWSPDGKTLAYAKPPGIWLADAAGTRARLLLKTDATGLAWSPDGTRLAFSTGTDLLVADLHGAVQHILGPGNNVDVSAWSPDGRWIAYLAFTNDPPGFGIWVVHPDGSGDHLFVPNARRLVWSPDGTRIAYTEIASSRLAVADAAGGDAAEIGSSLGGCLAWPAPGERILACSSTPTRSRLVALSPDGSGMTVLTDALTNISEVG